MATFQALEILTQALIIIIGLSCGLAVAYVIHAANRVVKSVEHGRQVVTTWSGR